MADYNKLIPFLLQAEGGYVNNPSDKGGETNKGITWTTWQTFFGDTSASHNRFMAMEPGDWGTIFKKNYWDSALADQITSQRIANTIVDWVFNSGKYNPEIDTQKLIDTIFAKHLGDDGCFGAETIATLNGVDEPALYQSLIARRKQFYQDIVGFAQSKGDHSQDQFLAGWLNRLDSLVKFNASL